jgi:hypothetical protein
MAIEEIGVERPRSSLCVALIYTLALLVTCTLSFLWFWLQVGQGGRIPIDYIVDEHLSYNSSASFVYK